MVQKWPQIKVKSQNDILKNSKNVDKRIKIVKLCQIHSRFEIVLTRILFKISSFSTRRNIQVNKVKKNGHLNKYSTCLMITRSARLISGPN